MQTLKEKCLKCRAQLYGEVDFSNENDVFAIIYCLGCGYEIEIRDERSHIIMEQRGRHN